MQQKEVFLPFSKILIRPFICASYKLIWFDLMDDGFWYLFGWLSLLTNFKSGVEGEKKGTGIFNY